MKFKRIAALALGILAGIGGFIDTGGVVSATAAGARFHYSLVWTVLFGFIGFAVFAEMSGRITISSSQPTYEVIRTRLGPKLGSIPVIANVINHILTLAVDLFGMAMALHLLTGVGYKIYVPAIAVAIAWGLWRFSFTRVDTVAALFGLTMLVEIAAMIVVQPGWEQVGLSFFHPHIEKSYPMSRYFFAVAAMLGAFMTPYQFDFYSSGAVEEKWTGKDLFQNRIVAIVGTVFGALITLGLMTAAGRVLSPNSGAIDTIRAAAQPAVAAFGKIGMTLFLIGIFSVSMAASVELCMSGGYGVCQYFGWDWGKAGPATDAPAFNLILFIELLLAALIDLSGINPLQFTLSTMAVAAASLPFTFVPLFLAANDREFMGEQKNTLALNVVAVIVLVVLTGITFATPPLLVLTHGNF